MLSFFFPASSIGKQRLTAAQDEAEKKSGSVLE
jgi:hypothetical protein